MGIYDRDYSRDERPPGLTLGGDRMMVTNLILITIGVYVVQMVVDPRGRLTPLADRPVEYALALARNLFSNDFLTHPWRILNLVTTGFVHDRNNILHVLFNMFVFWFFGREVEMKYGRREFLWFYLTAVIVGSLAWIGRGYLSGSLTGFLVGALGGTTAVMLLYVVNFPTRIVNIWGLLPVPVWALGVVCLIMDLSGAAKNEGGIAYEAHLGGAFALLYWKTGLSLAKLAPSKWSLPSFKRGPKLKVHDPDEYEEAMSSEVDEILRKIQEQGQDSLTAKERRILERASRRYQQKHR